MKILIATDGSAFSRAAVKQACDLLLSADDEVRIVSAYDDAPIATEAHHMSLQYHQIAVDAVRKQAELALDAAVGIVREHPKGDHAKVETAILLGSPAKEIVAEAERWRADIVVVGSHGAGFWERALLGSVSSSVLNHAPCSVFVARR